MVSREFSDINEIEEESGSLLVKITKVPSQRSIRETLQTTLSAREEEEYRRYGYRTHLAIYITGEIENRATNIILVNGTRVPIGDVPFALFLRLVVELFKNRNGTVPPRARLLRAGTSEQTVSFKPSLV